MSGSLAKPTTTTMSLIGVRAGQHTTIVIAMLKSLGYVELRIDEMRPRLLEFGASVAETGQLLASHKDLVSRLRSKQDQVEQLLAGADKLVTEQKTEDGILIYEAMAESLGIAWAELNRQLDLRGYILEEALIFYQEADKHAHIVGKINSLIQSVVAGNTAHLADAQAAFNALLDTTATAVKLGASIIRQISVLGNLADNAERPSETANACLQIERIMLKLAQEWESVETVWNQEKEKLEAAAPDPLQSLVDDQVNAVQNWLRHAQATLAHAPDATALANLAQEGQQNRNGLQHLLTQLQTQNAKEHFANRVRSTLNEVEEVLRQIDDRGKLGNRVQEFLQNATGMLSQLDKMEVDLANASAAIAGELGPLARQKATTVIEEGQQILRSGPNAQVSEKLSLLQSRLQQIEQLAKHRIQVGNQLLKSQISNLTTWLRDVAEPFLASNGNIGNTFASANEFLSRHKQFATEVINKEHEVNTVLNRIHELSSEDRRLLNDFEQRYENLKQVLESRIQLGANFQQVQKFSRELDQSFSSLSTLLDEKRDFSSDQVVQQMNGVFQMVQETLQQERHQSDKFVANAKALSNHDVHLNSDQAVDAVRQSVTTHEEMLRNVSSKWSNWQQTRALQQQQKIASSKVIEEVQMWQVDTYEIIRDLEALADRAQTVEEREHVRERAEQILRQVPVQTERLQELRKVTSEKEHDDSILRVQQTQQDIADRLRSVQKKMETTETFVEESTTQKLQKSPPRLLTTLRDAQIDEGNRFEFAARVEAEPVPTITWTKDGMDIKANADYRQSFNNGVAKLTIEETFIEDSALYTIRVQNPLGTAESSAKLMVKSKSQMGQKPRFVKQLQNISVNEEETVRLDCVVVAQPEPEVVWFKEEETLQESERVKLEFRGDHCSLTIHKATPTDTGLYKASARNQHGESTNFCRVVVQPAPLPPPKKVPPPTAPKPKTPIPEAPAFTPSLVNQTVEEGKAAVFQVRTTGSPAPKVTWKFKEAPIRRTETVRLEEEEGGWSRLTIDNVAPQHTGLYTVEAVNESGEARTGATLIVTPSGPTQQQPFQSRSVTMIQSEGFWSDGAYTGGTPTPPPVPQHRYATHTTTTEEFQTQETGELGFSSIANAPDFVRPFHREYTVNEGEKSQVDCLMVGNPRPKVQWFFNDKPIKSNYQFAEFTNVGDTYSIVFGPAKLENAGFYRMVAENIKGKTECTTCIHVRPRSLIPQPTPKSRKPHTIEHQRVVETFGAVDYNEVVPHKHQRSGLTTPPPAKRPHAAGNNSVMSHSYHAGQQQQQHNILDATAAGAATAAKGNPPHFSQTLVSTVTTVGEAAKFEGVVTGAPPPEITWSKDGEPINKHSHPHIDFSNIGGRVMLAFRCAGLADSGKYMCSAKNASGVATSSAQLVVRPKTVAPDFVKRLISEEIMECGRLEWTVRVTGDPLPTVTWLRDGQVIPNCQEVQLIDDGTGVHSMIIPKVELVDGGQFTCLAENVAGEARSTADLVVRQQGTEPGTFFHVTKVTQERQVKGEEVSRNQTFSIENPRSTPTHHHS